MQSSRTNLGAPQRCVVTNDETENNHQQEEDDEEELMALKKFYGKDAQRTSEVVKQRSNESKSVDRAPLKCVQLPKMTYMERKLQRLAQETLSTFQQPSKESSTSSDLGQVMQHAKRHQMGIQREHSSLSDCGNKDQATQPVITTRKKSNVNVNKSEVHSLIRHENINNSQQQQQQQQQQKASTRRRRAVNNHQHYQKTSLW